MHAWFAALVRQASPELLALLGLAVGAATLAALVRARRIILEMQRMQDTPTALIRSAAQGYTELEGLGRWLPGPPVRSRLRMRPCLWWRCSVTVEGANGSQVEHWSDVSDSIFRITDPSGDCVVVPDDAEVTPSGRERWTTYDGASGRRTHHVEEWIDCEVQLYLLGRFETVAELHGFADVSREVSAKLAAWKRDPERMRSFDTDGDGQVDQQEWEAARRAAQAEVEAELADDALRPGVHVMRKPRDGRPFILSTVGQAELIGRLRWRLALALGLAAACAGIVLDAIAIRGG